MFGFFGRYRLEFGPWQAFERALQRLLLLKGWEDSELVGGSGDEGADVIAMQGGLLSVWQCKFVSASNVCSADIIRETVNAMDYYDADMGFCVSNRPLSKRQNELLAQAQSDGRRIKFLGPQKILRAYESLEEWHADGRELYPYQASALECVTGAYRRGNSRALLQLATGLGKTFVAASFVRERLEENLSARVLVLADQIELIKQFDRSLWSSLPKSVSTHLLCSAEVPTYDEGVLLSTFQSFSNYVGERDFDFVIVDEAHHLMAPTYLEVLESITSRFVLGLTATPDRSDGTSAEDYFGPAVYAMDVVEAMSRGWLSGVDYRVISDNLDLNWIGASSSKGYTVRQLNRKLFIPERDEKIAEDLVDSLQAGEGKRVLVFCNSSEHAMRMSRILKLLGVISEVLLSGVGNIRDRASVLRKYRQGRIDALCVYDIMNEGVDVPEIDMIVYCRVTHSKRIFLQQMGRGLRWKAGKRLMVRDYVTDIRRASEILSMKNRWDIVDSSSSGDIEELRLPDGFVLDFSDHQFLNFMEERMTDVESLTGLDLGERVFVRGG